MSILCKKNTNSVYFVGQNKTELQCWMTIVSKSGAGGGDKSMVSALFS